MYGAAMPREMLRPCRALWKAITSAAAITRAALTVTSSGSPGPSPTPHSLPGACPFVLIPRRSQSHSARRR
ncbi:Uncharacterised protein [Mycobacteroides abscessus subsp. abscessus]|nr:Uncharacterised protein [Mycobacteroides abscessus subsp. abscessus]